MNAKKIEPYQMLPACGLYYNSITTVVYDCNDSTVAIYNRNDSGQYYKTMILANLALGKSVNYYCNVCCKMKHNLQ